MKTSQLYFLIANLWLIGGWIVNDIVGSLIMFFVAVLWCFVSLFFMKKEQEIQEIEFYLEKSKYRIFFETRDELFKLLNREKSRRKRR